MKKYYFNDGTAQQGPFTLEELQAKNINTETPVWYDGLPDWTTAGQVEELKDILAHTPPPFHGAVTPSVEEIKIVVEAPVADTTTTVTVAETPAPAATVTAAKTPAISSKKSTAWLSYVLALLVLGGVGYLVYQDMEKNKGVNNNTATITTATDSMANTTMQQTTTGQPATTTIPSANDTTKTETTTNATTEPATTTPATTTVTPTTSQPATVTTTTVQPVATKPTAAEIKAKQVEAQKLAQKKAEEEKKKIQAAQAALAAAAAKEKEYRNNWPKYIVFGKLDYNTNGDGIDAFNVPVFNGTNAMLDKVTVRVDYMKKDKKVLKSETLFIYNIPPGTGLNGKAPESKKGNNIKVFITGITSRKLHFCYPSNNGNTADPYFCN
jgi:chemotaxis protein histidine kinase CheA